jgi:hypothetical protein
VTVAVSRRSTSTRAELGWSTSDGRWRGVWNHNDDHTEKLGQALIERVAEHRGDLAAAVRVIIDDVPEGWSSFYGSACRRSIELARRHR